MNPNNNCNCNPRAISCPIPNTVSIPIQNIPSPPAPPEPPAPAGLLQEFVVGTNVPLLPDLPTGGPLVLLSTVVITTDNPGDRVRLSASIRSSNLNGSVNSVPLDAILAIYVIRRVFPTSETVRITFDTDIDNATTTFDAIDQPGTGTFVYVLEGRADTSTSGASILRMRNIVFTAEEIGPN
ncbi:TPA: hypothetical protein SUB30_004824 [Bacillus pseudomycoides]|nr:hypothetical protein [Bacillus pseudomycoides]